MDPLSFLEPSAAGMTLAAVAIVAGAPMFSGGMRAVRLRRRFRHLETLPLRDRPGGFAHVHGKVTLESPLFGPLSSTPCAGFQLEVVAEGLSLHRTVDERRDFRVEDAGVQAVVRARRARWAVDPTAERELRAADPLTEGLAALLERVPEALWWRRAGGALRLVERALVAGASCHVVGTIRALTSAPALEWARTGTDDARGAVVAPDPYSPVLAIGHDDPLDFLLVSDAPPRPEHLRVPARRTLGVLLGPALSLAGMIYLASAADYLRALGRF